MSDVLRRVLVVDDEPSIRETLAALLGEVGFEVAEANDALSAVGVIETSTIDAVVTDVGLPGLSGLDLLAILKRAHPQLPVLLMTANPTDGDAMSAHGLGADAYLSKPINVPVLVRSLRAATHE